MKFESKYLTFTKSKKQNPKTMIYNVHTKGNTKGIFYLGQVKWFAQWRQYAFYPQAFTVFEKTCLKDLHFFCINLNLLQRKKKK